MNETEVIWKYPIALERFFKLDMPIGAEVVHVSATHDGPQMWVRCNRNVQLEKRVFAMWTTGDPFLKHWTHLGTFMLGDGAFVGHLFEGMPAADDPA